MRACGSLCCLHRSNSSAWLNVNEAIERLNRFTSRSARRREPTHTTEELRSFFAKPPQGDSPPPDEPMMAVISAFRGADETARRNIVTKLDADAQCAFLSYAPNMALLAVRRTAPELVVVGLCALAVEGARRDIRDSIVALAKLHHSAIKLGMNACDTFSEAASLVTSDELSRNEPVSLSAASSQRPSCVSFEGRSLQAGSSTTSRTVV